MHNPFRIPRPRRPIVVLVCVLAALMMGGSAAAYGFDRHSFDVLMPGTTIGGVSVGGLDVDAATRMLRLRVEDPLHRPIHIHGAGFDETTTPWALGYKVDVRRASSIA